MARFFIAFYSAKKIPEFDFETLIEIDDYLYSIIDEKGYLYEKIKDNLIETAFYYTLLKLEVTYFDAFAIHEWILDNVFNGFDDGSYRQIYSEDIKQLHHLCNLVLEKKDYEFSKKNLPIDKHAFNLDSYLDIEYEKELYGENYYALINDVKEFSERILKTFDFKNYYLIYRSGH